MDTMANNSNNINNNLLNGLPEERGWEYKQVTVTRVPGYGFGIAVSGGRDNPHFASGDPSIAVSDVLASGPAERMLQVNDRIISVNGISLQNVDYATAVQVLRDSGDTVVLVVKRRTAVGGGGGGGGGHQHTGSYVGLPLAALGVNPLPPKVTLTRSSKKEDFGIVLGCKLFVKEISSKAREQLLSTNQIILEGDFVTKINNTSCNDVMSIKEAKKIIDSTKDKLQLTVVRTGDNITPNISHQAQSSVSTTGAVNNFYKGDDFLTSGQSYSNQNLYVQPPTRNNVNMNNSSSGDFDDKIEGSGPNSLGDDKSNLVNKGRSRGPLSEANLNQFDNRNSMGGYGRSKGGRDEPPRPPPPRAEDYYSSRRQLYDDDPIVQKTKQPIPDARFITFHKEGSVGIRLTGGNSVGIFVTAVQPGSPASLQGLQPGDKILKVNDMDMKGVTREEAVLFLLSLVDRIELIVQFCKEEYDGIVASQKGDSFYIKTHFHYENPAKGEMSFRSGDIFHVIDTLYNGVVGCWQVFRIGRNNQEVQKGIIPNKARAEELATAQFNATKKEMSANESRGSFFRRRRSSNRRSKSLGKEHWDDILFSDTISKFPAYERVVLKHPGFTRPVILFGPISDVAREKLLKDFPDKFISPQLDVSAEESKSKEKVSSNIIRLSAIKDVISTGKHALLDITPNAVERLNYAQMYPIVVFFKADTKIIIKQLRQGLPKSAHKSSKKLLEQCQKLDKVWNHIFCATITLNDNTDNWYRKVREIIDKQQSGALWMSESKPEESLSDDFLFPMSSLRLSYASSPESDLEHSPGPPVSPGLASNGSGHGAGGRLTKASSDPSVVMPDAVDVLPPYQASYDSRYGFSNPDHHLHATDAQLPPSPGSPGVKDVNYIPSNQEPNSEATYGKNHQSPIYSHQEYHHQHQQSDGRDYKSVSHKRQMSSLHGNFGGGSKGMKEAVYGGVMAPDLPPRVDRAVKPMGLLTTPGKIPNGKSAHERLFGTKPNVSGDVENSGEFVPKMSSLERSQNSKSDSLSSYDSFNNPQSKQSNPRIMPNAHDDLKTTLSKLDPSLPNVQSSPSKYGVTPSSNRWQQQQRHERVGSKLDLKYGGIPQQQQQNVIGENEMLGESPRGSRELDPQRGGSIERESKEEGYGRYGRSPGKRHVETKTDYGKYSRNNSSAQDYAHRTSSSSHQDLTQSHLSVVQQMQQHHMSPMKHTTNGLDSNGDLNHLAGQSGNNGPSAAYKPIPPPKPKNYKPPYKNQQNAGGGGGGGYAQGDGMMQPPLPYQHGKSHSNPVDHQRGQNFPPNHNYYYNMPQTPPHNNGGNWHTETAVRYNSGMMQQQQQHHHQSQYDMAPPYHQARRQTSISYASRSEITPIAQHDGGGIYDGGADVVDIRQPERPSIVDLQGSREQRGSAFELYRKPVQHNLRERLDAPTLFGSQPNIARRLNTPPATNKITPTPPSSKSRKLSKSQSFRLARDLPTPNFLRRLLGGERASPASATPSPPPTGSGRRRRGKFNSEEMSRASRRDVTSAVVDRRGARLVNEYWGVTLEVPEGALPDGAETEIYFVVSDPRLCDETPPLDSENGETMLSPMVMCGPQGIQFQKPVILNIPHYANTLPSLGISLKATDSEQDVCTDWDSILLPSNHAANSVAVKVDHF